MKRHPAMAANICPGTQGELPESLASQIAARQPTETEPHLELTAGALRMRPQVPPRPGTKRPRAAHALLLSGRLDRSSTHLLEAEIERLYESGVREITLDLAQLSGIDFAGVAVVAFRRNWCRRHGCELALVHATPEIRSAFESARAGELLSGAQAQRGSAQATGAAAGSTGASIDRPAARIIAAVTKPTAAGRRIIARSADPEPVASEPADGASTTPIEEAGAATV
jgi:anti-anti-sigma factor